MVRVYDTTLRDGEQREGIALTLEDKVRIARQLDALGVAYIEGGFPASNPKDAAFFARMREFPLDARIVAFGTTCHKDVSASEDEGLKALLASACDVVSIVGKASVSQVEQVLGTTKATNLRMIADSLVHLSARVPEVIFDAEHFFDGFREDGEYALAVVRTALEAGVSTVVLCDTNGGTLPHEIYETVSAVRAAFPSTLYPALHLGIHAHDDCSCAVANTLEAVRAGVTHVQGTINGYGERSGNADLIALIANLELKMGIETIGERRLPLLTETAHLVAEVFNVAADPYQPYVGSSAFAHKGGLHGAAAMRCEGAYEHVVPAAVGNAPRIVVSELAGCTSLVAKASEFGIVLDEDAEVTREILGRIKILEARGYSFELADASLALLIRACLGERHEYFRLESFRVISDKNTQGELMTEATIKIHVGDERFVATGEGNGPVNALDIALRQAITRFYPDVAAIDLVDFKVRVLDGSHGTDAVTRVLIESSNGHDTWGTIGVHENVVEASWGALVDAISYGLLLTGVAPRD